MVDNEDGGVPLVFMLSCVTMLVILSCITFVSYGVKSREQELMDYYASPLTQEQIDEAWEKFEQREAIRKPPLKGKLPEYIGD